MTETTEPSDNGEFGPDDLVQAVLLIDEGVSQGAYRSWETIQRAAKVRAKILAFAQQWQAAIEQNNANQAAAQATTETETPTEAQASNQSE